MDLFTIMLSIARFFKNKLQLFLSKGYKIKVDKNCSLIFEKEEHYESLFCLERVFLDLLKNNIYCDDEHRKIRIFFHTSLIENYVKKLPEIKVKSFNDFNHSRRRCKKSLEMKFPNLRLFEKFYYSYLFDGCKELDEILETLKRTPLEDNFIDLTELISDKIIIKDCY